MIIFLFGKDSYRSRQKLNEIISRYQAIHQSGLNFLKSEANDFDLVKFQDGLQSVSMFAEKKLVVAFDFLQELAAPVQEKLLAFLKATKLKEKKDVILVFYESSLPDKNLKLFQFLKRKPNQWQELDQLTNSALESWIKEEVIRQGARIEPLAIKRLAAAVSSDLWRLHNEIVKLVAYTGIVPPLNLPPYSREQGRKKAKVPLFSPSKRSPRILREGFSCITSPCLREGEVPVGEAVISAQDIDFLVETKFTPNIFKTIDALAEKNKKTALRLLYQHLHSGADPLYLLTMFVYQWRNLLQIKDLITRRLPYYELAKKTGLHPFVVRKTYQQAQRFSFEELKNNYQDWQELDEKVKRGALDPVGALTTAVLFI